jgi:4-hydroxybenzoate polyprenyltransferase
MIRVVSSARYISRLSYFQKRLLKSGSQVNGPASGSWIDDERISPRLRPYLHLARIDKQVGTMLLFWPCAWSVCLAAPMGCLPDILLLGKFAVGAFVMRGAGCTINDLWDMDFDKHVERTKNRPLARGDISVKQALMFLTAQLSCGLAVLVSFNIETILLGLLSMPLVVCYPLMKRFTNWPQFVLGLTFNWGALVGWTAAQASAYGPVFEYCKGAVQGFANHVASMPALDMISMLPPHSFLTHAVPLYIAGVNWTLIYDTLYGYQDRKDDARIGNYFFFFLMLYTSLSYVSVVIQCCNCFWCLSFVRAKVDSAVSWQQPPGSS